MAPAAPAKTIKEYLKHVRGYDSAQRAFRKVSWAHGVIENRFFELYTMAPKAPSSLQTQKCEKRDDILFRFQEMLDLKIRMCAPGGAHICSFKIEIPEIEKGCRLPFGTLTGSLVERPSFEVRLRRRFWKLV